MDPKRIPLASDEEYDVQTGYVPPYENSAWSAPPALSTTSYAPPAQNAATSSPQEDLFAAATQQLQSEVVPVADQPGTSSRDNVVLQFNDSQIPTEGVSGKIGSSKTESKSLLGSQIRSDQVPAAEQQDKKYPFYSIKRYRAHFNVDTNDVLERMMRSVLGFFKSNFFDETSSNPDLYGPFWVATTLIFVYAVTGNLSNYIHYVQHQSEGMHPADWFDIYKVSFSAALFYGYVWLGGFIVWAVLKWFKSELGLVSSWCTYGYALTIFIPTAVVCIVPNELLRWIAVGLATTISGIFLLLNFRQPVFEVAGAKATPLYLAMGAAHLGVGLAMKLYFFQYWNTSS